MTRGFQATRRSEQPLTARTHAHALPSGDGAKGPQRAQSTHRAERRDVVRARHHGAVVYER